MSRSSPGPVTAGATYHQIRESDEQDLRIAEFERDRLLVVETIPPSKPELRRRMTFSRHEQSTVIHDSWMLDLGVPKGLQPVAAARARSGVKQNLGKLKGLLESGQTTLQDGREVTKYT
jgi:hypothetical protein